ncbi:MAG: enoyl-CoA hydratase/isomerase family protein [Chloroflexi bacterium]|nr:enoyl-CoA hydratase/isomerase family protein [Chloroflexota bacterium]
MDYGHYKHLIVEKKDKIATVTMNHPDTLNAITFEMHREITRIFEELAWDDDVWAVIFTGAGKAFCVGGDIQWFKRRLEDPGNNPLPPIEEPINIIRNIVELPRPVIAAVNGPAVGLGASLALSCDIIIASEKARISDPHVRVGISAGDGGCVMWPLLMGMAKAKEYLFTGDPISAVDAAKMGMINKAVPPEQVMPEARAFATRLVSEVPPLAIKYTKMAINKIVLERLNLVLPTSFALQMTTFNTNDHVEAVNAFLEKRTPNYTGT